MLHPLVVGAHDWVPRAARCADAGPLVVAFLVATSEFRMSVLPKTSNIAFGIALLALGACSDPLAPFQPEVSNVADNFALQATGVSGVSRTVSYTWNNSATRATINHSTTTTAGSTQLTVRDAAGTIVYSRALAPSLNEPTTTGVAGAWTVQLQMSSYSGTLNFRAQKL
jgi:hypothetical protein